MDRISKANYYLDIAQTVLERATCLRRVYGAIIVKNDEIISTGYNGAPRGRANCVDLGYCSREAMQVPRGERYELCRSVHAEANAIISASRRDMVGGTLYLVGRDARTGELLGDATSCSMCRRLVINAGLKEVVIRRTATAFDVVDVADWVAEDDLLASRDADALADQAGDQPRPGEDNPDCGKGRHLVKTGHDEHICPRARRRCRLDFFSPTRIAPPQRFGISCQWCRMR